MTELCAIYEITRETGYYWLRRYQQGGLEALSDRNRAPRQHPNQTPEEIAEGIESAIGTDGSGEVRRDDANFAATLYMAPRCGGE